MKHYNLKPIRLALRPSARLALIFAVAGSAACAAMLSVPLHGGLQVLAMALIIALTAYHILRDALLRLPQSIVTIEVGAQGEFRCHVASGEWQEMTVLGDSFVTPWLTVLNLRHPGRWRAQRAILLSDSADAEMLRRLRVWLRWGSLVVPGTVS